jgi:serine/threonine-protein kinase
VSFEPGALIGGRYRLEQSIGSGGMGEVFRADDVLLGRSVAIKLVHAVEARRQAEVNESFLQEARIAAAITHPNVVRMLDFGVHEQSTPYMVMELLSGETLAHVLERGVSMPLGFVFELIERVLDGLKAAHAAGVIHRDLKPENIFLTHERGGLNPKLLDFGIAKNLDATGVAHVTTAHGHIVGTPAYMSPEQARGVKAIDPRTDIYSMGVVIYELLSTEIPFFSENPGDLLVMIMTARERPLAERVPGLPQDLSEFVQRAMAKSPAARFRDAGEMLDAFRAVTSRIDKNQAWQGARSPKRPGQASHHPPLSPLAPVLTQVDLERPANPVVDVPTLRPRVSRSTLIALALLAIVVALGIPALRSWWRPSESSPRFIVVQADPPEPLPSPAPAPEGSLSPASVTSEPMPPGPRDARGRKAAGAAEAFARSFRAQRAPIVGCVNAYPDELKQRPRVTLRLAVSTVGEVTAAQLLPAELTKTPLAQCIEAAARNLKLPKQPSATVFDVPLTARKGG